MLAQAHGDVRLRVHTFTVTYYVRLRFRINIRSLFYMDTHNNPTTTTVHGTQSVQPSVQPHFPSTTCGMIVGEAFFEDEEDSATQSVRRECSRAEQQNSYVPKQCPPEARQHLSVHSCAHKYN